MNDGMLFNWSEHVAAWSSPPVDDVGYVPSADLLAMPDDQFTSVMQAMRATRYTGWRNHGGLWRDVMGLDTTAGRDVMDFGCGTGLESVEYARAGNRVVLADLAHDNIMVAMRAMELLAGVDPETIAYTVVGPLKACFRAEPESLDVFHANGVLHHIPWARRIMESAHRALRTGGEARLMLYSDEGWRIATGTRPPQGPPEDDPAFTAFVRYFDSVGSYADWYDREKLINMFGDLFHLERFEYLTADRRYCAAVLRKMGSGA